MRPARVSRPDHSRVPALIALIALAAMTAMPVLIAPSSAFARPGAEEARRIAFEQTNEAQALLRDGEHAEAVALLREVIAVALNSFPAHYAMGQACVGAKLYGEAVEPLEIALDLQPGHLGAMMTLAEAHFGLGDLESSRAEYYRVLSNRADYSPALTGLGRLAAASGQVKDAMDFYSRAIRANPGYPEAFLHLGELEMEQGDLDAASINFREALSLNPDLAMAHNRLALVYSRLELFDAAYASARKAAALEPREAMHWSTLGRIVLKRGNPRRALEHFETSRSLDPDLSAAPLGLAESLRQLGDYGGALEVLRLTLERDSLDARTASRLADARAELAVERDRIGLLREEMGSGGIDRASRIELAGLEAGAGRFSAAADLLEVAVAPEETTSGGSGAPGGQDTDTLRRLVFYSARAGRMIRAAELAGQLAKSGDADAATLVNLGIARAWLGQYEGAVEAYRAALDRPAPPEEARLYLGVALFRLGRRDDAMNAFRDYLGEDPSGETAERVRGLVGLAKGGT